MRSFCSMARALRRLLGPAAALALIALGASPAATQAWRQAESPNFIVYSDGSERGLREFAAKLETFDRLLRARFGVPADRPTRRKLPIYLVGGPQAVRDVAPYLPDRVAGFYIAGEEDIFAVAARDDDGRTIFHEYAHHFFFQHFTARYPGWLVEGMAEYVETVEFGRGTVTLGGVNPQAAYALEQGAWIPLETLLSTRFFALEREADRRAYYPVAWLLTHWLLSDPARTAQLETYLRDVSETGDPVGALQRATGMDLVTLRRTLGSYQDGVLRAAVYEIDAVDAPIVVTRLSPAADDLLLIGQRLKLGLSPQLRAEALAEARRRGARWADDPMGLLVLGHAELHFGDADLGETLLTRLLERQPDNVEALQFMAMRRLAQARDAEPAARTPLLRQARDFLARAYAVDDDDYLTVLLLTRTRQTSPDYPNANDLALWEEAFVMAPQLSGVRLGAGQAFLAAGQPEVAIAIAAPLANSPHADGASAAAQQLIERARAVQDGAPVEPAPDPTAE